MSMDEPISIRLRRPTAGLRAALALVLAAGGAGCMGYDVTTVIRPDGSGERSVRVEVTGRDDLDIAPADFTALTHTRQRDGWRHAVDVDEDGDTTHFLTRSREVGALSGWSDPELAVRISAAPPAAADRRLGYVRLGDVELRSAVEVSRGESSRGRTWFEYRESLTWNGAVAALVEFSVESARSALRRLHPDLTPEDLASISGFARARMEDAVAAGLLEGESTDDLTADVAARTARYAAGILESRSIAADTATLRHGLTEALSLEEEGQEERLERLLPGLYLAGNSEMTFRLLMPGQVLRHNAARTEGDTLIWEVDPLDLLDHPLVMEARSEIDAATGLPSTDGRLR